MSVCIFLNGIFTVPAAQLQRAFDQRSLLVAALVGTALSTPVLIGLSLWLGGPDAFAWSRIVAVLAQGAVMLLAVKRKFLPGWNSHVVMPLLVYGLPIAGANLLSQVIVNVDNFMIGRQLSVASVGLYTVAFNMALLPASIIGSVLNGVVLPAFSRVRAEGGACAPVAALRSATRVVALIAAPIGAGIAALAGPLIKVVYGDQWASVAPVLSILSVFGVLFVFGQLMVGVLYSFGRSFAVLLIQVAGLVVLVPLILIAIPVAGMLGVAVVHVIVAIFVTLMGYLLKLCRTTSTVFRPFATAIAWPFAAAAISGLIVWLLVPSALPSWLQLILGGVVGAVLYAAMTFPILRPYVVAWNARRRARRAPKSNEVDRP